MLTLSWQANADSFDVALVVNRLLARGVPAWWCTKGADGVAAGDYLVEASDAVADSLARLGIKLGEGPRAPEQSALRLTPPRLALLAGHVSAYPYFGFNALTHARLGLSHVPVAGADVAAGALDGCNQFVLPGGFSLWTLDRGESAPGADAATRAFLDRGGACIGFCGGAAYLSAGRPGWTRTVEAMPRLTHEYLQGGVGVVTLKLEDELLALGCPPLLEVPYYHGPSYTAHADDLRVVARYHDLRLSGRLAIDNPLDPKFFETEMKGHPAALMAEGPRGRAVVIGPHPEMGDLVRKYIALDGYVRKYLPIRGKQVMDETLAYYQPGESPSFRLVLNAIHAMATGGRVDNLPPRAARPARGDDAAQRTRALGGMLAAALSSLDLAGDDEYTAVLRDVVRDLQARAAPAIERLLPFWAKLDAAREEHAVLLAAWLHLIDAALPLFARERPIAQRLMEIELAICLGEAWRRLLEVETGLA